MPFSSLRSTVHMAVEASYGVAPANFVAANTFVAENIEIKSARGEVVDRNPAHAGLGGLRRHVGPRYAELSFDVALVARAGAANPAPYRAALLAAAMAETIQAGVSVTYSPVSAAFQSAALLYNKDGQARIIRGIRGGIGFRFNNGQVPYLRFEGMGLYAPRTTTAMVAQDYTGWGEPDLVTNANTDFKAGAFDAVMESAEVGVQNMFDYRNRPNQEAVSLTKRRNYEMSLKILDEDLASFDPEALMLAQALMQFQVLHGAGPGRQAELRIPNGQIVNCDETDIDGEAGRDLTIAATTTMGGDSDFQLILS
jgi:hypothetical protein